MTPERDFERRGLSPDEVAPVPGMSQVLSALDLLAQTETSSVVVSVASGEHDSELIALSQEAAEESGILMEFESQQGTLALRFTRDRAKGTRK